MQIVRRDQGISYHKPDGTDVVYYLFTEYELHYNEMPPQTVQEWHHHNMIEEAIYVIAGVIELHWIENNIQRSEILKAGDMARVENHSHTLKTPSNSSASFVAIRLVLTGNDNSAVFKNDKTMDQIGQS